MSFVHRILVSVVVITCFIFGFFISLPQKTLFDNSEHKFSYTLVPPDLYKKAIEMTEGIERSGATSGIVAHHLLVADKIAQTFASLGTGKEKTVIVLSPNHFKLGESFLQTTNGTWQTEFGDVEVDTKLLEDIMENIPELAYQPATFQMEHGVSAIVPFVKAFFPRAKILPILIDDAAINYVDQLAQTIQDLSPQAIVISSIDMSHNLPEYVQKVHDEITLRTIESGDCHEECSLEIDANMVLQTLFEINRLRETQKWKLVHHGSSLQMGATSDWQENTSHILGYFEEGKPESEEIVSIQFVGDVMLDRGVRFRIEDEAYDYPVQKIDRFMQGVDVRVANLEGTVSDAESIASTEPPFRFTFDPEHVGFMKNYFDVVSLANNHSRDRGIDGEKETQVWLDSLIPWFGGYATTKDVYRYNSITLIGFNEFGTSIDELVSQIQNEREDQFVIVFPHWGEEYIQEPQEHQRELAHAMAEAGADLIIGSHPHVIQGIEMIENVPVVYSLGNFIFDQVEPNTDIGLSVSVQLSQDSGKIYLLPVKTGNNQPSPMSDAEATNILQTVASQSSQELAPDILIGMIPFIYD